jgi:hypothetical protein
MTVSVLSFYGERLNFSVHMGLMFKPIQCLTKNLITYW